MSHKVCVLSQVEIDQWTVAGIAPSCTDHRHVKLVDAKQMSHHGDFSPYSEPIARFVGPHHILMNAAWTWQAAASGRWPVGGPELRTMQLVEGG